MPQKPVDPWGVKSVAPYTPPSAAVSDPWGTPNDPNHPAGLPDGVDLPQLPDHAPAPSIMPAAAMLAAMSPDRIGTSVRSALRTAQNTANKANAYGDDLARGAGKSILNTGAGVLNAVNHMVPPGFIPSDARDPLNQAATPSNSTQKVGMAVGNAAQFLIPGLGEEKAAAKATSMFPSAARYIAPLARTALQTAGSGVINKLQGGSFGAGAAGGVLSGAMGEGMRYVAPKIAEAALGVRAGDRAYGRTPGQAIMQETTGVRPGTIADQAVAKHSLYTNTLNNNAIQSSIPVDLQPARDTATSYLGTAIKRNNPSTRKEIGALVDQLSTRPTGAIPQSVSADEALALRRGVDDLQGSWNPNLKRDLSDRAVIATRQSIANGLEKSIPDYRELNSKISTLFPVASRANASDLNAGPLQRSINRLARPTGALAGAGIGGAAGYKEDGLGGAALGAGIGLFAPEVLTNPTNLMMGARSLYSPVTRQVALPAINGLMQQFGHSSTNPPNTQPSLYGRKR